MGLSPSSISSESNVEGVVAVGVGGEAEIAEPATSGCPPTGSLERVWPKGKATDDGKHS